MKTNRDDLIVVALRLFLTKGYDKTSMMDLARAAQVSKGAFHHYFPRKEALLQACLDHFFTDFLPDPDGPSATLHDMVMATADSYALALIRLCEHQIPLPAFQAFLWDQLRHDTQPILARNLAMQQALAQKIRAEKPLISDTQAARSAQQFLALIEGTGTLLCLQGAPSTAEINTAFQTTAADFLARL